jgi:nitrite reductase/ring-hydroxylating ferredoxin subunit
VPEDLVTAFYLADRRQRVSVARVAGRLYAFDDLCTCAEPPCPLSGGLLTGTSVMCQCHGSRFDVTTGAVLDGPATEALRVYEVQQSDGQIQIRG